MKLYLQLLFLFFQDNLNQPHRVLLQFFLFLQLKKRGQHEKLKRVTKIDQKSFNMSIHMIHFCTQYRKFWQVLSIKWILFMFPFYAKNMLKISFMFIFLQLRIDKRRLQDDQMGAMAPPTSRTIVLCCERPLSSLFLKKVVKSNYLSVLSLNRLSYMQLHTTTLYGHHGCTALISIRVSHTTQSYVAKLKWSKLQIAMEIFTMRNDVNTTLYFSDYNQLVIVWPAGCLGCLAA